jgi:hypothetical protein
VAYNAITGGGATPFNSHLNRLSFRRSDARPELEYIALRVGIYTWLINMLDQLIKLGRHF